MNPNPWFRACPGTLIAALLLAACRQETRPGGAAGDSLPALSPDSIAALSSGGIVRGVRQRLPPALLVRRGACPFECCVYRTWTAGSPVAVYESERATGVPLFTIPAGQSFRADSGNVHITGVMLVAVLDSVADAPYWSFVAGDTLVVLESIGEGHYNVWDGHAVRDVEGFWESWRSPDAAETIGEYRSEWWVHVTLPDGRTGWFHASPSVRITGDDACG